MSGIETKIIILTNRLSSIDGKENLRILTFQTWTVRFPEVLIKTEDSNCNLLQTWSSPLPSSGLSSRMFAGHTEGQRR